MGRRVSELLVTTIPGLEDLLELEVRKLLLPVEVAIIGKGRVLIDVHDLHASARKLVRDSRLAEHVIAILWRGHVRERADLEEETRRAVRILEKYLCPGVKFAVQSERVRSELISSVELARLVGLEIERAFADHGVRVCLDNPDIVVYTCVQGREFLLGIHVTPFRPLHERRYRAYVHPSVLNPIVANAMLDLARDNGVIIDPFCGSATILVERGLRGDYSLLLGMDVEEKHVRGALTNSRLAGVDVNLVVSDARLPPLRPIPSAVVVTNPPFGIRERAVGGLRRVYDALVRICTEIAGGRAVILSPHRKLILTQVGRALRVEKIVPIEHGGLLSFIFVFSRRKA